MAAAEHRLYGPVRDFLVAQGFSVRGEVHGCDVAATRGDDLVVVELKAGLTVELLVQVTRRFALTDLVYAAVPRPASSNGDRRMRDTLPVLRRLECGLLLVDLPSGRVDVALTPLPLERRRNVRRRRAVLAEVARRPVDTTGGTTRRPLATAYRVEALTVAHLLVRRGPSSPKELRALGAADRTGPILRDNVYGWFEKVDRGIYRLGPAGRQALQTWADVVDRLGDEPTARPAGDR